MDSHPHGRLPLPASIQTWKHPKLASVAWWTMAVEEEEKKVVVVVAAAVARTLLCWDFPIAPHPYLYGSKQQHRGKKNKNQMVRSDAATHFPTNAFTKQHQATGNRQQATHFDCNNTVFVDRPIISSRPCNYWPLHLNSIYVSVRH